MTVDAARLLGFAFASADLLFEIDRDGKITFATGATSGLIADADLVGRSAMALMTPEDGARFLGIARGLAPGERTGPLGVALASGGKGNLSLCYLPQNAGRISCTLVRPGGRPKQKGATDGETGLPDREAFFAAAAERKGSSGGLALVNLPGLNDVCAHMSSGDAQALLARIGDSVKSMNGAAGRLSPTGFGVISEDPAAAALLASKIRSAAEQGGVADLEIESFLISLKNRGLTQEQTMLAVRHVVTRFAENKLDADAPADIGQAFDSILDQTLKRAHELNITVSDGAFDLVFEPIIDLETNMPSHYEALTRFAPGQSPGDTIKFAEDVGIADAFDLAVVLKVFALLESQPNAATSVAVNVSGRSIAISSFFAMLAGLLMKKRGFARRVLIEITESSELPDLTEADKAIQALRSMGYRVGIDDFGAGAASLQYLQGFSVDFVKVDGGLIRRLGKSQREDAFVRGTLRTCAELGTETVAEWIDTPDKLQRCRDIGFNLGQGRYFGGALTEFPKTTTLSQKRPRRIAAS